MRERIGNEKPNKKIRSLRFTPQNYRYAVPVQCVPRNFECTAHSELGLRRDRFFF